MKLRDICKFQSGGTPSKNKAECFHGTIPWIGTVALNGRSINQDAAVEWITDKAIAESAAKIVPPGSVMVGTRVGVGKVAVNSVPMSTSQDIISLVGIDENAWDTGYLCKFLPPGGRWRRKARGRRQACAWKDGLFSGCGGCRCRLARRRGAGRR
ncbi:MAG: restriction endonuclease subunit S [Kiritimatiellae bacterium]|nr:restriction endonuclease subunit S [Kiritimatiellia bacterium]